MKEKKSVEINKVKLFNFGEGGNKMEISYLGL